MTGRKKTDGIGSREYAWDFSSYTFPRGIDVDNDIQIDPFGRTLRFQPPQFSSAMIVSVPVGISSQNRDVASSARIVPALHPIYALLSCGEIHQALAFL